MQAILREIQGRLELLYKLCFVKTLVVSKQLQLMPAVQFLMQPLLYPRFVTLWQKRSSMLRRSSLPRPQVSLPVVNLGKVVSREPAVSMGKPALRPPGSQLGKPALNLPAARLGRAADQLAVYNAPIPRGPVAQRYASRN